MFSKIKFLPLAGFFSLCIAFLMQFIVAFSREDASFFTIFRLLSFFTIDSNLLLLFYFSSILFFPDHKSGQFFKSYPVSTALVSYLSFVFIIYHLLLINTWNPTGMQYYAAAVFHIVNPLIMLAYWIYSVEKEKLPYSNVFYWLIFPTVYFIYVVLVGMLDSKFPYPFFDLNKVSLLQMLSMALILLFCLMLISSAYIFIGQQIISSKSKK